MMTILYLFPKLPDYFFFFLCLQPPLWIHSANLAFQTVKEERLFAMKKAAHERALAQRTALSCHAEELKIFRSIANNDSKCCPSNSHALLAARATSNSLRANHFYALKRVQEIQILLAQVQDYADASLAWTQQGDSQLADVLQYLTETHQIEEAQNNCCTHHSIDTHLPELIFSTSEDSIDRIDQIEWMTEDPELVDEMWKT
jgi:hypothetical protein